MESAAHRFRYESLSHFSELRVRTVDGLRVALAGLSPLMPVAVQAPLQSELTNVGEARTLERVPCALLGVRIPYRITSDSVVDLFDGDGEDVSRGAASASVGQTT